MGDLLIGTRKGLFLLRDGDVRGPLLTGWAVFHAVNVGETEWPFSVCTMNRLQMPLVVASGPPLPP